MWRKSIWCLGIILFVSCVSAEVKINEIMYNPGCYMDYCEWVELYNNDSNDVDLSNWKFDGNDFNDINISSYGYVIITRNLEEFIEYYGNFSFVVDGSFSLSNNGDIINLTNGNHSYSVIYEDISGEDYSLEYYNGRWYESLVINGTPGRENSINISGEYKIRINEFLPDPEGNDDADMPNGEWIELYNDRNELNLRGFYLEDKQGHRLYIADTTTLNGTIIPKKGFLVVYTNGFFGFLNNDGIEEIRLYNIEDKLIDEVVYADSMEGISWALIENRWNRAIPSLGKFNKVDFQNISSWLKIKKIYLYDNKATFGESLMVEVSVFKGNTSKYSVQLYIIDNNELISKRTKFNVHSKFEEYVLTLPVQIKPNCDNKYKDGEYELILTGLDLETREKIKIEGLTNSLCKIIKEKSKEIKEEVKMENEDLYFENNINESKSIPKVVYESKNIKAERYGLYFFCFILILMIIYFMWGKEIE